MFNREILRDSGRYRRSQTYKDKPTFKKGPSKLQSKQNANHKHTLYRSNSVGGKEKIINKHTQNSKLKTQKCKQHTLLTTVLFIPKTPNKQKQELLQFTTALYKHTSFFCSSHPKPKVLQPKLLLSLAICLWLKYLHQ